MFNKLTQESLLALLILGICIIGTGISFYSQYATDENSNATAIKSSSNNILSEKLLGQDSILVLNLDGIISEGSSGNGLLSKKSSAVALKEQLLKLEDNNHIKGILLRINSPGGTVGLSQEIYQAIRRLRQKKIIVASMGDVAASGGYYIASACDKIFANPGTLTGSIGVITKNFQYSDLLNKHGIKERVFKAGEFKDIGSGSRSMTKEEQIIMQNLLDDTYEQFLVDVYEGRYSEKYGTKRSDLEFADIADNAEGLIYTGRQALKVNLIDNLGGYYESLKELQKLIKVNSKGKIKKDLPVIKPNQAQSLDQVIKILTHFNIQPSIFNSMNNIFNLKPNYSELLNQPVMVIAPEFL